MSDLGVSGVATFSCPNCAGQCDSGTVRCEHCGADLQGVETSASHTEPVELSDAERAADVEGFDTDAELSGHDVVCGACGSRAPLEQLDANRQPVTDPTESGDVSLITFTCARCGAAGRLAVAEEASDAAASDPGERGVLEPDPSVEDRDDDVAASVDRTSGSTGPPEWADDRPSSPARFDTEVDRFESSDPGSLREQGPLLDEDGDDIRMYTGEPVETDEGWVVPVQQNFAGKDNIAGGGEWPDPDAPPAQAQPSDERDESDESDE